MDKKKLIIAIVCGIAMLAVACVVLVGLTTGQWPWQNSSWAADYTGMPPKDNEQTQSTDDTTLPTGATDGMNDPTIGVEVENGNSGSSGNGGNSGSSGNGGNSGNSGGNKAEIDFDDLLGKGDDDKKPTPETTTPETTTPETTTPETTDPDSGDEEDGIGERPEDTDIDVPINNG